MQSKTQIIGITTTVPSEILYAANFIPVDLNNIFIANENPDKFVEKAEIIGFPGNSCAWIKGIFSAVKSENIKTVIAPVWGDCSNTHALCEVLKTYGINIIEFAYPYDYSLQKLKLEMNFLFDKFNINEKSVFEWKKKLDIIRKKLKTLDKMTVDGKISGKDNHLWLVNSSDFYGNPEKFDNELDEFLKTNDNINKYDDFKRIGVMGVPSIWSNFYDILEENKAHVVYNEVQFEFSMIKSIETDFYNQYINYTYPYGMDFRLKDIIKQMKERDIQGLIHYTQCFCFRQIEDILVKNNINIPVLTLEGDKPGEVDARTKMRIENFMDII